MPEGKDSTLIRNASIPHESGQRRFASCPPHGYKREPPGMRAFLAALSYIRGVLALLHVVVFCEFGRVWEAVQCFVVFAAAGDMLREQPFGEYSSGCQVIVVCFEGIQCFGE